MNEVEMEDGHMSNSNASKHGDITPNLSSPLDGEKDIQLNLNAVEEEVIKKEKVEREGAKIEEILASNSKGSWEIANDGDLDEQVEFLDNNGITGKYIMLEAEAEDVEEKLELVSEAKDYCITDLAISGERALVKAKEPEPIGRIPLITSQKEERLLISSTTKPVVKLLVNRHNNKQSYTNTSDDNLLKNIELFDKLSLRFSG